MVLGASGEAETPDPIPNSAVKRFSADGSLASRDKSKSVPRTMDSNLINDRGLLPVFLLVFFMKTFMLKLPYGRKTEKNKADNYCGSL